MATKKSSIADFCTLWALYTKELEEGTTCDNREYGEHALGLETKFIGAFQSTDAAKFALEHILNKQANLVGYNIEEEEDLSVSKVCIFDENKTWQEIGEKVAGELPFQFACFER